MNPKMIKGTPTIAPTTVIVKTRPAIIKTIPKIAPTSRPVSVKIQARSFQRAMKGQVIQVAREFIFYPPSAVVTGAEVGVEISTRSPRKISETFPHNSAT
jgi:hypothetical protein